MSRVRLFFVSVMVLLLIGPALAAGPGCGGGCCRGERGDQARGGPGADHDAIHSLLANHEQIRRTVERIEGGVRTVTVSDDPEVTRTLREHVWRMKERMETGRSMRHWDPLFVELFRHHERIRMEVENVPGGVRVVETSDDARVVALIVQHAERGVSEFVERGFDRAHEASPLPKGY